MAGELTRPDPVDDADARARAMTGADLEALEAQVPSERELELLDYTRGAHLELTDLVALTVEVGALAKMLDQQAHSIAAYQARLQQLVFEAAVKAHARQPKADKEEGVP